jgi:hypothetical protein
MRSPEHDGNDAKSTCGAVTKESPHQSLEDQG